MTSSIQHEATKYSVYELTTCEKQAKPNHMPTTLYLEDPAREWKLLPWTGHTVTIVGKAFKFDLMQPNETMKVPKPCLCSDVVQPIKFSRAARGTSAEGKPKVTYLNGKRCVLYGEEPTFYIKAYSEDGAVETVLKVVKEEVPRVEDDGCAQHMDDESQWGVADSPVLHKGTEQTVVNLCKTPDPESRPAEAPAASPAAAPAADIAPPAADPARDEVPAENAGAAGAKAAAPAAVQTPANLSVTNTYLKTIRGRTNMVVEIVATGEDQKKTRCKLDFDDKHPGMKLAKLSQVAGEIHAVMELDGFQTANYVGKMICADPDMPDVGILIRMRHDDREVTTFTGKRKLGGGDMEILCYVPGATILEQEWVEMSMADGSKVDAVEIILRQVVKNLAREFVLTVYTKGDPTGFTINEDKTCSCNNVRFERDVAMRE